MLINGFFSSQLSFQAGPHQDDVNAVCYLEQSDSQVCFHFARWAVDTTLSSKFTIDAGLRYWLRRQLYQDFRSKKSWSDRGKGIWSIGWSHGRSHLRCRKYPYHKRPFFVCTETERMSNSRKAMECTCYPTRKIRRWNCGTSGRWPTRRLGPP